MPASINGSHETSLGGILARAETLPFLKSVIIFKNGHVILEEYMHGGAPDRFIDIKSASKSILSAVLGIAISEGYITGIDQPIVDFFPEYLHGNVDPQLSAVTIRHLVTMTSGLGAKENAAAYQRLYASTDWIGHMLSLRVVATPGETFNYLSFNTHILSAIITRATGMSSLAYAEKVLFAPLAIDRVIWAKDPQGYPIGGWGLSMRARDMAAFGLLYANNGKVGQRQVVPSEWINASTALRTGMIGTYYSGWDKTYGYGYLWWIKRTNGNHDVPFAAGHGGQRIVVVPSVNAVMVTQADSSVSPQDSRRHHRAIDSFLFNDVMRCLLVMH